MSAVIMPTLNTEVVNLFLEQFSPELPAGVHAVLIWDGAGFHTGADVVVPSNVSLIQLPPYSPELNPVENLWHYLRAITGRTAGTGITTRCRRRRSGVCVRSAKTQKRSRPSAILDISQGADKLPESVLLACTSLVEPPVPGLRHVAGGGDQESVSSPRRHKPIKTVCNPQYLGRMKLPESVHGTGNRKSRPQSMLVLNHRAAPRLYTWTRAGRHSHDPRRVPRCGRGR